jgi:hypothetical protein
MGRLWNGGGKAHGAGMARGASGGRALPCLRRAQGGPAGPAARPNSITDHLPKSALKAERPPSPCFRRDWAQVAKIPGEPMVRR